MVTLALLFAGEAGAAARASGTRSRLRRGGGLPPGPPRGPGRPPLAIGDSTMLLALDELAAAGFEANAHGCREFPEAISLLEHRRASRTLPHIVVIALGADGHVTVREIVQDAQPALLQPPAGARHATRAWRGVG